MTKIVNKYVIKELSFPVDGIYKYEVQRWTRINGGQTYAYCGFGKYCRTKKEARAYKAEMEALEPRKNKVKAAQAKPERPVLNGIYYFFDCMNAFVNDGLFPASEFKDDAEAVRMAADYEASLYKYEFTDGARTGSSILYEPMFL